MGVILRLNLTFKLLPTGFEKMFATVERVVLYLGILALSMPCEARGKQNDCKWHFVNMDIAIVFGHNRRIGPGYVMLQLQ